MDNKKVSLAGLKLNEIEDVLKDLPRFRSKQIFNWIANGAGSFELMSNIPKTLRGELERDYSVFSGVISETHDDEDAKKIIISLKDQTKIESVLLCDGKNRFTACLSTQAGCPAGCVFCKTGSLGFKRNLDHKEIIEQYLHLKILLKNIFAKNASSFLSAPQKEFNIENIVIMGMGEPLLNLDNLRNAVSFFTSKDGMNFSRRRITVSTCGICKNLFDLAKNGPYFRFALSLTTADETLRGKLMPISKENPLCKIKEALLLFQKKSGSRLTLEIPLLGGINTRESDAQSIADFSKGLDSVINLIPWNPAAGLEFEGKPLIEPEKKEIENFIRMLEDRKLNVTMRRRKGRSIMGACGQLGVI